MKTSSVLLLASLICTLGSAQSVTRCFDCPENCATCRWDETFGQLVIETAQNGFSVDNVNGICYKTCPSDTYYLPEDQVCYLCGDGCLTCDSINGDFVITSAKRGYLIDQINEVCYQACNGNQYYDPSTLSCQFCPNGCSSCEKVNGTVIVTGANRNWIIDSYNNICYQKCESDQFYDPYRAVCETCPNGCSSCVFDENDFVIIKTAYNGYSIDTYTNTCYLTCTRSQYYDASLGYCLNCPDGCATCQTSNGFLEILSPKSGFQIDPFNNICYRTCGGAEYYDFNTRQCLPCPENCLTCSLGTDGVLTILTAARGYSIDQSTLQCYPSCQANQYYYPF